MPQFFLPYQSPPQQHCGAHWRTNGVSDTQQQESCFHGDRLYLLSTRPHSSFVLWNEWTQKKWWMWSTHWKCPWSDKEGIEKWVRWTWPVNHQSSLQPLQSEGNVYFLIWNQGVHGVRFKPLDQNSVFCPAVLKIYSSVWVYGSTQTVFCLFARLLLKL